MTKVFIGGSRNIGRLSVVVRSRLDRIVAQGFPILVGDANGADKAVQQYLHSKGYANVMIYCSGNDCRNNMGSWPLRLVTVDRRTRDRRYYSAKDMVMAEDATVGLMIWDGKSAGTLMNVLRLLRQGKTVVVYDGHDLGFREMKSLDDWQAVLAACSPGLRAQIDREESAERSRPVQAAQASLWPTTV